MWPSGAPPTPTPAQPNPAQRAAPKSALLLEFSDHIRLMRDVPEFENTVRACAGLGNKAKINSYVGLADRHEQSQSPHFVADIAKLAAQFSTLFAQNEVVTANQEQLEPLFMFKLGVLLATNDVVVCHTSRPSLARLLERVHEHKPAHFGSLQLLAPAEMPEEEAAVEP